ncbi:MAG: hypothetical protein LH702_17205 [Phormidesmis sp. CAN_BIN44]|nr:hypothetical protein [Phormidesmis sp. CAN_BIN44]
MLVIPTAMSECLTHTHSTQPSDQKENGLLIEEIWKSHLTTKLSGGRQPRHRHQDISPVRFIALLGCWRDRPPFFFHNLFIFIALW